MRQSILKSLPKKDKMVPSSPWGRGVKFGRNEYRKEVIALLKARKKK